MCSAYLLFIVLQESGSVFMCYSKRKTRQRGTYRQHSAGHSCSLRYADSTGSWIVGVIYYCCYQKVPNLSQENVNTQYCTPVPELTHSPFVWVFLFLARRNIQSTVHQCDESIGNGVRAFPPRYGIRAAPL